MWEKERWENIPLSQTDQLQGIHLCRMKVMTTIFPFRGRMDQEILWTVQVCGWWNSPLLIAGAGRHSPGERSLEKREDKSRVYVTSNKCPSQDSRTRWNLNKKPTYIRNVFEFLGWRKTVVEIMCIYLGCEDQKTPMHISPGSEHVLWGASEVGAAQETQDSNH